MRRYAKERRAVSEATREIERGLRLTHPELKPSAIRKLAELSAKETFRELKAKR